jgi:hypothetical protein
LPGWVGALLLAVATAVLANQQRVYAQGVRRAAPNRS